MQNAKCKNLMPSAMCEMSNECQCQIPNSECRMPNAKCRMPNAECFFSGWRACRVWQLSVAGPHQGGKGQVRRSPGLNGIKLFFGALTICQLSNNRMTGGQNRQRVLCWGLYYKTFYGRNLRIFCNKLECLSLASFS